MICFGTKNDAIKDKDRVCNLCAIVQKSIWDKCSEKNTQNINDEYESYQIRGKCDHARICWDEYTKFMGCRKNFKGLSKDTPTCIPNKNCIDD